MNVSEFQNRLEYVQPRFIKQMEHIQLDLRQYLIKVLNGIISPQVVIYSEID